jgi:hypothetical protein
LLPDIQIDLSGSEMGLWIIEKISFVERFIEFSIEFQIQKNVAFSSRQLTET